MDFEGRRKLVDDDQTCSCDTEQFVLDYFLEMNRLKLLSLTKYLPFTAFVRLQPSVIEFASLIGGVLWSIEDRETVSDETAAVASNEKKRICDELHEHYVRILPTQAPNYAKRIALMADIIHALDVSSPILNEAGRCTSKDAAKT